MAKGGGWERDLSKSLSAWYSHGLDDSWIWRTAMSGGRSTVRAKQGKKTSGGAGDLTFTDQRAAPLFDLITFEAKRGYAKTSLSDLIDRNDGTKPGEFEQWVLQAMKAAETSGTEYWMIIHKRNNRPAMCYFPHRLFDYLKNKKHDGGLILACPFVTWRGKIRTTHAASGTYKRARLIAVQFDQFLDLVNPISLGAQPCPPSANGSSKSSDKARRVRRK